MCLQANERQNDLNKTIYQQGDDVQPPLQALPYPPSLLRWQDFVQIPILLVRAPNPLTTPPSSC